MAKLIIEGGKPLRGRVRAGGRKNSAVAVLPAALLCDSPSRLENLPAIDDVTVYGDILQHLGCKVSAHPSCTGNGAIMVDPGGLQPGEIPYELTKRLRASYYLLGVMLARHGAAQVPLPGGCDIGLRPIDQHLKGLRALGADVSIEHGVVTAKARCLTGTSIYLDVVSVGATINIMLAATLAQGTTVIENAAREPHVVDLANYLNAAGARVQGAGTDVIRVRGVNRLNGCAHAIIPDEIEAATYMIAAASTGGDVQVDNVIPKHLDPVIAKLQEVGAEVTEEGDSLRVRMSRRPRAVNVKTLPYPGFPTDAQQPMTVLLSVAEGTSIVTESIWESRFKHVDELKRMGTNIRVEGRTAIIEGVAQLTGAPVTASDLRAGAALVVAALAAQGETAISGIELVDRGYENVSEKLRGMGAEVSREK
ncbi:MAG TPA: UDP-N-acetylglucosamine 1-carboxyvinyltransferase [Bacillota bacterium]|nr:UDP-N-acetylglucosamine 1-carboxyvinyltransferase [Bacillota bacterium]